MKPGQRKIAGLVIESLAHDGRGIGFLPGAGARGKAVFVAGALPGQTVDCHVTRSKAAWLEAELDAVLASDTPTLPPHCAHHHECGGCPLQCMPYAGQLEWKARIFRETLIRIGHLPARDVPWSTPLPSPLTRQHRNKIELAFGRDASGAFALGFRRRSSHQVFNPGNCVLLDAPAAAIVRDALRLARETRLAPYAIETPGFWRSLVLRRTMTLADPVPRWRIILITMPGDAKTRKIALDFGRRLLAANPEAGCFIHEERKRRDLLAAGEKRVASLDANGRENPLATDLALPLGGRMFQFDAASFFQVNDAASQSLAEVVLKMGAESARDGGLLDICCGVGAPGQLLAPGHNRVLGVDYDARAVEYASGNAKNAGLSQCGYDRCGAATWLGAPRLKKGHWSAALLDPPRSGMEKGALARLISLAPENIIQISCNPATMARDAALISQSHELIRLASVDLFPHTAHLECCALWRKREHMAKSPGTAGSSAL